MFYKFIFVPSYLEIEVKKRIQILPNPVFILVCFQVSFVFQSIL
jgi:hypothetical protein